MEAYAKFVIVALLVAAALVHQPAVAAGQTICGISSDGLMSCKPSVAATNAVPPSAPCCSALSGADFQCLCRFKKSNSNLLASMGINPNLAMQLPAKCNLPQPISCA